MRSVRCAPNCARSRRSISPDHLAARRLGGWHLRVAAVPSVHPTTQVAIVILWLALVAMQQRPAASAQVIVTPANPVVVVRDSLRLRAHVVDAEGRPVPGARISYAPAGFSFEARVDTTGLVQAGAVGTFPVTAVAFLGGNRVVTKRVEVRIVPGPPSRIVARPPSAKLLVGQRLRVRADVFAATDDRRDDRVAWSSSAPTIAQVSSGE